MHWSRFYLQTKISHQTLMFLSGECANVSYILCIIIWVSRFFVVYIQTSSFVFINSSLASFKISQENHFWNCITKVNVLSTPNILLHFKPALTARNYILKRIFLCFLKNNLCTDSWIFLRNFFICCLSLEDQMKWAVQKAKKDLERATKFQVTLEDELHSNKQGLPFLRCHCLGYVMHVHSLCLPFLTSHANLQFFGPRYVMHVNSLCLPFLPSHANLQFFGPR